LIFRGKYTIIIMECMLRTQRFVKEVIMNALTIPPNPLLEGMTEAEQKAMLECLKARVRYYDKGENLLWEHENADCMGIIVTGLVEASKLDMSGKRLIISRLASGSVFGDVLSLRNERRSPVTVTALERVSALLLPVANLLSPCARRCENHDKLIRNLLNRVSEKYFELLDRIACITKPTMREKIIYFLKRASDEAAPGRRGRVFSIPYDRTALAEYLHVERSALSRELSAMKRDGLIDYHKNTFRLL